MPDYCLLHQLNKNIYFAEMWIVQMPMFILSYILRILSHIHSYTNKYFVIYPYFKMIILLVGLYIYLAITTPHFTKYS